MSESQNERRNVNIYVQLQYMCPQFTKYMSKSTYGDLRLYCLVLMYFSTYISWMQFRDIFRRANLCKWADPYPAKNEIEAAPNNNMAAQWIPNVDVFFVSLVRVIRGARSHLSTNQVDSAEFWCRRLDEYEWTLTLLLSRVEESRLDQEAFLQDL